MKFHPLDLNPTFFFSEKNYPKSMLKITPAMMIPDTACKFSFTRTIFVSVTECSRLSFRNSGFATSVGALTFATLTVLSASYVFLQAVHAQEQMAIFFQRQEEQMISTSRRKKKFERISRLKIGKNQEYPKNRQMALQRRENVDF